ncbi:MAG: hypothetical protein JSV64_03840 [Candidatus Bathyarchaeota archaeon]|nr:MAG: hypothetical protein JSV64_03840 [Candidatus Bathyarchaeota archaeon]
MVSFEELLAYITISAAIIAAIIVLYATRFRRKEERLEEPSPKPNATEKWRHRVRKTISLGDAKGAKNELRTLSLEREILSDAIRRLYEAHAEGKITEEERELLARRYKTRMMTIRDAISHSESLVALHELEAMQEDLIKLFDERFDDLNNKIATLRSQVGVETEEIILPETMPIPQIESESVEKPSAEKERKRKAGRRPRKSRKTVAEERIEKIRSEVEKVLDRLEQMEVET